MNKGDETHPKYRSRFVARELKQKGDTPSHWSDFFASMPPITALRALFTLAVTMRVPNLEGKLAQMDPTTCLIFIDVKKAHFWSPARRRLLVELPSGMGYPPGKVGLLRKSLYGTRDAPANWEAAIKALSKPKVTHVCTTTPRSKFASRCTVMISPYRTKSRVRMVCRRTSQTLDD